MQLPLGLHATGWVSVHPQPQSMGMHPAKVTSSWPTAAYTVAPKHILWGPLEPELPGYTPSWWLRRWDMEPDNLCISEFSDIMAPSPPLQWSYVAFLTLHALEWNHIWEWSPC